MQYRNVSWKRNYAKIPANIRQKLTEIETPLVEVAQTKIIRLSDIAKGNYKHVGLVIDDGDVVAGAPRLPPENSGKWSFRNLEGWERKRHDLPMITKTFTWETPNFGDASTYGTHMHSQDREVYQVEFDEPRAHQLRTEVLKQASGEPPSVLIKFSLTSFFDTRAEGFEKELLWAINLLQENTGVVGVFGSDATEEEYVGTIDLDWEIFPPGTADEIIAAFRKKRRGRATKDDGVMEQRLKLFAALKPTQYMSGGGKFSAYVGAQLADDLVIFENVRYGNALYVLYDTWREVSRRSRIDLLRGTSEKFDRFPHTEGWEDRLLEHIKIEKDKRKKPKRS